jgi:hypothetical protein
MIQHFPVICSTLLVWKGGAGSGERLYFTIEKVLYYIEGLLGAQPYWWRVLDTPLPEGKRILGSANDFKIYYPCGNA